MSTIGLNGVLTILSHVFFIWISFNVIQVIDFNKFIKKGNPQRAQVLLMFFAITLGFTVSNFFISLIEASQSLKYLF
ncbi:DUF1146 family protein [Companilactobacillus sp. DQM5]|uniref:DUF1146 family protein n=1 Tax=Companilactobacillus sp. DQM5 TaxID=3463359 RepID=UPI00405A2524